MKGQALAHVELELASDTSVMCIQGMPGFLGHFNNLLMFGDLRLKVSQRPLIRIDSIIDQVTRNTHESPQDTVGQVGGVSQTLTVNAINLMSAGSISS